MRAFTPKEKKLAIALLAVLFAFANLFGLTFLARKKRELEADLFQLRSLRLDAKNWMGEKGIWEERKKWLETHQPRMKTLTEASANFLETLQSGAQKQKISILEQGFLESPSQEAFPEVGVKLKVEGTLESLVLWMTELQQPANFQAVTSFSLKSDAEPPKVKCDLQIVRMYAAAQKP